MCDVNSIIYDQGVAYLMFIVSAKSPHIGKTIYQQASTKTQFHRLRSHSYSSDALDVA